MGRTEDSQDVHDFGSTFPGPPFFGDPLGSKVYYYGADALFTHHPRVVQRLPDVNVSSMGPTQKGGEASENVTPLGIRHGLLENPANFPTFGYYWGHCSLPRSMPYLWPVLGKHPKARDFMEESGIP